MTTKVEKLASDNNINLSLVLGDDVVPTRIVAPIPQEVLDGAITFDKIMDNKGKIDRKKITELGVIKLVYIGDKKKLSRISFCSMYDANGNLYGSLKKTEDKTREEFKRYSVVKPEYKLDMNEIGDVEFFLCAMAEPCVYGSINSTSPILFKVISPTVVKEKEAQHNDNFVSAVAKIAELNEVQIKNIGVILGLDIFMVMDSGERKKKLVELAGENPKAILNAMNNEDAEYILILEAARRKQIILEKRGILVFQNNDIGVDVKSAVSWLKRNEGQFEILKDLVKTN